MVFKLKLRSLRRRSAKEDCSVNTTADTEEPNAIEKFLNDASTAVTNIFLEASDGDDSSASCSTNSYITEANPEDTTDVIDRFLNDVFTEDKDDASSTASSINSDTSEAHTVETNLNTFTEPQKEDSPNVIEEFLNNASSTVGSVFQEAMKTAAGKVDNDTNTGQPNGSNSEVKGNPAARSKLKTKLEKKEKQIEKLKQQLSKAKEEEAEAKKNVNTLARKLMKGVATKKTGRSSNLSKLMKIHVKKEKQIAKLKRQLSKVEKEEAKVKKSVEALAT